MSRRRLYVVLGLVGFAIAASVIPKMFTPRPDVRLQRSKSIDLVQKRGGVVVFRPSSDTSLSTSAVGLNLSKAKIDLDLVACIPEFTAVERVTIDGQNAPPEFFSALDNLPHLTGVSASKTNINDSQVADLPTTLRQLSLQGCEATDACVPHLAKMSELANLDISSTRLTATGVNSLVALSKLQSLRISEACVNAESAVTLRKMPLHQVDVVQVDVTKRFGRTTFDLLAPCDMPKFRGLLTNGRVTWDASLPWDHTLSGVVEAIVAEIGLDPSQTARMFDVLSNEVEDWRSHLTSPDFKTPDNGREIESVDEFFDRLHSPKNGDEGPIGRFARKRLSEDDIPRLIAAIRSIPKRESRNRSAAIFLLVQFGIHRPDVIAFLDEQLARQTESRYDVLSAFSDRALRAFAFREGWRPSQAADDFAVPRLMAVCEDKTENIVYRQSEWVILAEIATRRPELASRVLMNLPAVLDENAGPNLVHETLVPLAKVDATAAMSLVPQIQALRKEIDPDPTSEPERATRSPMLAKRIALLNALSAVASPNPSTAEEVALEYLARLRANRPIGPLAPLLSPAIPETNRRVVLELLDGSDAAKKELGLVAKQIRDWHFSK